MARYTQLDAQQIQYVAGLHNLTVDSYRLIGGGAANSSYLLQTAEGKYVLTVYDDKSVAQITNMGKALGHLAKYNFPTVVVVPTSKGDAAAVFEGKPVMVKEYIQGQVVKHMDDSLLTQVGEVIARLHQIPAPDYLSQHHPYGLEMFSTFIGLDIDAKYEAWLSERLTYLEEHTPANLPRALIHGDLFYDNVLFQARKFQAMIDFEEVCNYYKVFDLGMALLGICAADGKLNLEQANALMAGYLVSGKLDEMERHVLQVMVETAAVATSCWRYWKYNLHDPTPEREQKHWEMVRLADQVRVIDKDEFMACVIGG